MKKLDDILRGIPCSPVKIFVSPNGIGFLWSHKKIGFGEIFLSLVDGKIEREGELPIGNLRIDAECMSKEFVKRVLCQAIDESEFK